MQNPLDNAIAAQIYDKLVCLGCNPVLVINGFYFHSGGMQEFENIHKIPDSVQKNIEEQILKYGMRNVIKNPANKVFKIIILFSSLTKKYEIVDFLKNETGICISYSKALNIEINALGANKGNALKTIAAYLNVPIENTMAIGDSDNDLSMIQQTGISVAMGNAEAKIKEAADVVAPSNEEGAAKIIERFALEGGWLHIATPSSSSSSLSPSAL